jgi:hypothetical protein
MTWTTQRLVNSRTVVAGTDGNGVTNSTILYTGEWDRITAHQAQHQAEDLFGNTVEEFFAPLLEAAEKFEATKVTADDPLTYIVLHEGTEGVRNVPADVVHLSQDSQILRLIENNETSRLVWVGDDLEILAVDPNAGAPMTAETSAALDEAVALVQAELGGTEVTD